MLLRNSQAVSLRRWVDLIREKILWTPYYKTSLVEDLILNYMLFMMSISFHLVGTSNLIENCVLENSQRRRISFSKLYYNYKASFNEIHFMDSLAETWHSVAVLYWRPIMKINFSEVLMCRRKRSLYFIAPGWRPNCIFKNPFLVHIYTIRGN